MSTLIAKALPWMLIVYGTASLAHFVHNAEFLVDYPNLPNWLSRSRVYAAWFIVTGVGAVGYVLHRWGRRLLGLMALAAYAILGFDGLLHYDRGPFAAHTLVANVTILSEVAAAAVLLIGVVQLVTYEIRSNKAAGDGRTTSS